MAHPLSGLGLTPQLVMEDIFISGDPLLESVGLHEPLVEELRGAVASAVRQALVPLQAYAREYRKYLELNNNDVTTFLKCVPASVSALSVRPCPPAHALSPSCAHHPQGLPDAVPTG